MRVPVVLAALFFAAIIPAGAYSVLTHEAVIDSSWEQQLKPLLLARFPGTTPEALLEARAYAYGGTILQDMGYYPFGSKFFSDLTHYVRSGDFVTALLREAHDPNEYAFALGALAHYTSDNTGHPDAINIVEAEMYPSLRREFGKTVTYEDKPAAHLQTEFAFDVLEAARGRYASKAYHDFIGFQVSKPVLERAFAETYGLELKSIFKDLDLAIGTYRKTVSGLIPRMTKVAWAARKKDILKEHPGLRRREFLYEVSRRSYEKDYGRKYEHPGRGSRILAAIFNHLPKIGPLKAFRLRIPNEHEEKVFLAVFNRTLERYAEFLRETRNPAPGTLPNTNLDTGKPARQGDYRMADAAYAKLSEEWNKAGVQSSPSMLQAMNRFYGRSPAAAASQP